jgi:hypothetical protein
MILVQRTDNEDSLTVRVKLPFVVALPIPRIDRRGQTIPVAKVERWKEKALVLFGKCFGGAVAIRSPGPYQHQDGTVVIDRNQWVVQAGCEGRRTYLAQQSRIESFARKMGRALDQEAVFVLACPHGESVLIFLDLG